MREAEIQRRLITAAENLGLAAWPVMFRGTRGCPDLLVMNLQRYHCLLELKKERERARDLQLYYHRVLRPYIDVVTVAGLDEAIALLPTIVERSP